MGPIGSFLLFLFIVIIAGLVTTVVANLKIVPQSTEVIIERLGRYKTSWSAGLHWKTPFIERIVKKVSLKEQVADFRPQPVITKDNVTIQIDVVVFYQITDPRLYTYNIENPMQAVENLAITTLRNIIGAMELDATLTSRDTINTQITKMLDEATDKWGIKVHRVEVQRIMPPLEIQNSMERQMKAERERRESILRAEGVKLSAILEAEGRKQSMILNAEAEKEAQILRAEAVREQRIKEAQGEAEAIRTVQKALAESIMMLNQAAPTDKVLSLKGIEAFGRAANGRATKIIIPSNMASLAGLVTSLSEVTKEVSEEEQ